MTLTAEIVVIVFCSITIRIEVALLYNFSNQAIV